MRRSVLIALAVPLFAASLAGAEEPVRQFLRDFDQPEVPDPAPRDDDGRILLGGATPAEKGLWLPTVNTQFPVDFEPSYLGHSIGWWEGDTLVIETVGYNEGTWMDRRGAPNSDRMRTLERVTRTTHQTIEYEVTIDDPEVYTGVWTGGFDLRWEGDSEVWEYVCQQGNQANELMLGDYESVDRTTTIVP